MDINSVTLVGRLTRDAEPITTSSGVVIVKLGVASNDRVKKDGEWQDHANFFDVTSFSESTKKLTKGSRIGINGRLRYRSWEKDGHKRSAIEVVADRVQFLDPKKSEDESVPF